MKTNKSGIVNSHNVALQVNNIKASDEHVGKYPISYDSLYLFKMSISIYIK